MFSSPDLISIGCKSPAVAAYRGQEEMSILYASETRSI
jgi:hypothetical protein